jgi:uncharacterized protein
MVAAAFWSLAIAAACLWLPRGITSRLARRLWVVPTLLAALVALAGRMIDGTGLLVLAALAVGYVRWDPKLPSFWPIWTGIMLVLTALPEEAAFRGVIHTSLARWRGDPRSIFAIVAGGVAFGLAHAAGGPMYVLVAAAAGIGYGWIYASTGSIGAAILAHAALNAIHFLFFTYPAVAS